MLALSTLVAALCMWALLSTEAGQQAVIDQSVSSIESWGRTVDDANVCSAGEAGEHQQVRQPCCDPS